MDKQEIDDTLEGHSDCELTDFSVSGSEYLPSGADSSTYHLDSNADGNDEELDANEAMKRERFEMLLRCLHFHNNEEAVGEEPRMKKLQKLLVMLNDRFKAVRIPD
ncbi:hypothetical protein J6590_093795 [Homalodisca vitripennis]|nr:hypothetical protein J6590_093795 [Homalodisca vitripennis]